MTTDHFNAAIQAGAEIACSLRSGGEAAFADQMPMVQKMFLRHSESVITAALPHLRRAIIQELADEAEAEFENDKNLTTRTTAGIASNWLRAKLKEAENND